MTSTDVNQDVHGRTASDGGDLLVWILAWSELAAFGALLTAYVIASWIHPDEFAKERRGFIRRSPSPTPLSS